MSTIAVNAITDASGGNTASINGATPTNDNLMGRNRIINGDMRIDQRNAGASITPTNGQFSVDRWKLNVNQLSKISVQQVTDAPTGFQNSVKITSLSAYTPIADDYFLIQQNIEGYNCADFLYGTSDAKTATLSFYVKSSLTGIFGGAIRNGNGFTRTYPFEYTINSADTWEYKTITFSGDTTGTWNATNSAGPAITFSVGAGSNFKSIANAWASNNDIAGSNAIDVVATNGATFYITGVQLEAGSVATSFERRHYGQELALCQRYYWQLGTGSLYMPFSNGNNITSTIAQGIMTPPVPMRATPSLSTNGTASNYSVLDAGTDVACTSVTLDPQSQFNVFDVRFIVASGLTAGRGVALRSNNNTTTYLGFSSEL